MGVEIALLAAPVPLLAIARDIWIRARVEQKEAQDRIDRLEKERLDRQQAGDVAVINTVPAFLAMERLTAEREAEAEIRALKSEVLNYRAQVALLIQEQTERNRHDSTKFS